MLYTFPERLFFFGREWCIVAGFNCLLVASRYSREGGWTLLVRELLCVQYPGSIAEHSLTFCIRYISTEDHTRSNNYVWGEKATITIQPTNAQLHSNDCYQRRYDIHEAQEVFYALHSFRGHSLFFSHSPWYNYEPLIFGSTIVQPVITAGAPHYSLSYVGCLSASCWPAVDTQEMVLAPFPECL